MKVRRLKRRRVAPARAGAGIVCSRSTIPTDTGGVSRPPGSVFTLGSGVGPDDGPGFVGVCEWCLGRTELTLCGMCEVCCQVGDDQALDNSASMEPGSFPMSG